MAKIGILNPVRTVNLGGVFQYTMTLTESLKRNSRHEYLLFYEDPEFKKFCADSQNCTSVFIAPNKNKYSRIARNVIKLFEFEIPLFSEYRILNDHKLELLIRLVSFPIDSQIRLPYLVVVYDVMHRYYPDFPEYSLKVRIIRDLFYRKAAKHSVFTIVDSYQSKEDLVRFYKIGEEKIKVIPYCPPWYVSRYKDLEESYIKEVMNKYGIFERFIFYPAQFWHHKNHLRLIKALHLVRKEYKTVIPIVLTGSPRSDSKGTYSQVMQLVDEMNMQDQILNLGYLPEKDIVALYKKATALVFPSLIGPTNIPPLEAMVLGTPAVCSNLFLMPEQVGEAGLLFDPFNVEAMAEKIYQIWTDENLRQNLISKGYERVKNMTLENYAKQWENIIDEALERIK
jgi:glycosyltransferase involved in cell wall biosynthesis